MFWFASNSKQKLTSENHDEGAAGCRMLWLIFPATYITESISSKYFSTVAIRKILYENIGMEVFINQTKREHFLKSER